MLYSENTKRCLGARSKQFAETQLPRSSSTPRDATKYKTYVIFNKSIFAAIYPHRREHPLQAFRSRVGPFSWLYMSYLTSFKNDMSDSSAWAPRAAGLLQKEEKEKKTWAIFNNYILAAIYSQRRGHPLQLFRCRAASWSCLYLILLT